MLRQYFKVKENKDYSSLYLQKANKKYKELSNDFLNIFFSHENFFFKKQVKKRPIVDKLHIFLI
jgi:hypothetical protein